MTTSSKPVKIIGLSGTNGSGKDTVGAMLADKLGYLNVSATDMLVAELTKRGWPIDRTHKSRLSAEWRREYGMTVIVDKAVELLAAKSRAYPGMVVGSLRHPAEADRVHKLGGIVIWTDADPRVRYERIQKNLHERVGTHAEHGKTFEEFVADEQREMTPEGDGATLNMSAVRDKADVILANEGDDIAAFKLAAEQALAKYL